MTFCARVRFVADGMVREQGTRMTTILRLSVLPVHNEIAAQFVETHGVRQSKRRIIVWLYA
jgi:hypothetical protein